MNVNNNANLVGLNVVKLMMSISGHLIQNIIQTPVTIAPLIKLTIAMYETDIA